MKSILKLFPLALSLVLGCALLVSCGTVSPGAPVAVTAQTFNDQLGAGYTTVTTVRNLATTLLQSGTISVQTAIKVQAGCDAAVAALDAARTLAATSPGDAATALTSTLQGLALLQVALQPPKGSS